MAKRKTRDVLGYLSGKIGNQVHTKDGNVRAMAEPSGRELSPLQKAHQNRWEDSKAYGRIAISDPELNSWYASLARNKPGKGAWHFAIRDYYHAPVIGKITESKPQAGAKSRLRIKADDLYKVQRVMVCLVAPDGTALEKGQAIFDTLDLLWNFDFRHDLSTPGMKLTVMALDLPGNIVYRDLSYPYYDTEQSAIPEFTGSKKKEKKYQKSQLRPRKI